MKKKALTVLRRSQTHPFLRFIQLSGSKSLDTIFLGTVGILVLALLIYAASIWSATNSTIYYTPADVVHGVEMHAVHEMGFSKNNQTASFSPTSSTAKPDMQLSEKYYDFGAVNAHQVLTRTFVIANSGQSPLIIRRAYTTCGCTIADFTAAEIPPGKVVLMTLQFDTGYHDMRGTTVRRGVMIETNDPDQQIQEIWVQASVR